MKTNLWKSVAVAAMAAALWGASVPAEAQTVPMDPKADWMTLVFPSLVPKAGHGPEVPAGLAAGLIRNSYNTRFENYWKETSYFQFDPATGDKIRGFYSDSKTYGYVQMPYPIQPRGASALGDMTGDPFRDGIRRFSVAAENYRWTDAYDPIEPDAADADEVWTPGESFNDLDGDGQWDPATPAEDYWDNDNTQQFLQRRNGAGAPQGAIGTFAFSAPYRNAVVNPANGYSNEAGELFADYNRNHPDFIAVGAVGFDDTVEIYIAGVDRNIRKDISELDLTPEDDATLNEGDFAHTYRQSGINGGAILADIPRNGEFDYTADINGNPQVRTATYINGTPLVVRYRVWARVAADGTATIYENEAALPAPAAEDTWTNQRITISVPVYQARELYGLSRGSPLLAVNEYGDVFANPLNIRVVAADSAFTPAADGEPFEDFISWRNNFVDLAGRPGFPFVMPAGFGASGQLTSNADPRRRGRGAVIGWDAYEAYIRWNYPGDADALLARAGNGRYDGPEDWVNANNNKMVVAGTEEETTPEPVAHDPILNPLGNWHAGQLSRPPLAVPPAAMAFPTWQDWYSMAFSAGATLPPDWQADIPSLAPYTPEDIPEGNVGWIPVNTWSFDSMREFCDMPSSMYHLGGDVLNAITLVDDEGEPVLDPFTEFVPVRMLGGDYAIGEITSPFNDSAYGHDMWPDTLDGANPSGPDGTIPPAGPLAFNTIGGNAFDGANQRTIEFLTWRTAGDWQTDVHPRALRDTNLDGILDVGTSRVGDPYYNDGDDGSGDNVSFNRQRYMEDMVAIWDQMEDFQKIVDLKTDPRGIYAYPVYPVNPDDATNAGWAALGGPAGANINVFTRDTGMDPINIVFQVRPMNGATGAQENTLEDPPPELDPNQEPEIQDFGMGLLCHEQGHDIFGLLDLYDYDTWQQPREAILNSPIAGYDLMAGGFVHGVADIKEACGWITPVDLAGVVPVGEPVVVEMYPVERVPDQYYRLQNPANPLEYLDFWFIDNRNGAEAGPSDPPGGRGVYICHVDRYGDPNAMPRQQRVNNHYVWEIVQADGLSQLQDGINGGDVGDPFPGATNNRIFTPNTNPASRWWDTSDTGIRILDIVLPDAPWQPALVTMQRVVPNAPLVYDRGGADTDGDGIPDWWELQYFQNLNVINGTSDWDGDGLSDFGEYLAGTNPRLPDTDGDGVLDGFEDTDGDGMSNIEEINRGLDPGSADTDDDGIGDADELADPIEMDPTDFTMPSAQRALLFAGDANTYMRLPQVNGDTRFNNGSLSVEAWVSPTDDIMGAGGVIYSRQWTTGVAQSFRMGVNAEGRLYAEYIWGVNAVVVTSPDTLPMESAPFPADATKWTHVAASFNQTTKDLKIYMNGMESAVQRIVNAGAWTNAVPTPPAQRIGTGFRGAIDEVRIFNTARQPLNLGPLAGTEAGLVAYYKMDEGTSATPGADLLWGTGDDTAPRRGQIADTLRPDDWVQGWRNSGSLVGGAVDAVQIIDLVALFPYASEDPTGTLTEDSDGDGIPDWWELFHFGDLLTASEMTDADEDGVSDKNEQRLGTDPNNPDTDGDGILDGQEDSDGDGLTDVYEQDVIGTLPSEADTDDDGLTDYEEVTGTDDPATVRVPTRASSPINGFSPFRRLSALFKGADCVEVPDQAEHTLSSWTIQAMVRPDAGANGVLIRRQLNNTDIPAVIVNYQLGVYPSGGEVIPYIEFTGRNASNAIVTMRTDGLGTTPTHKRGDFYTARTPALPVGEWSHIAASYDAAANRLSLFIDGRLAVYRTDAFPLSGTGLGTGKTYDGQTTLGGGPFVGGVTQNGFEGMMDEVAIMSGARTEADLITEMQTLQPIWASESGYGAAEPSPLAPDVAAAQDHVYRQVIVRVKEGMTEAQLNTWAAARNATVVRSLGTMPIHTLQFASGDTKSALAALRTDAHVVYAEPNYLRQYRRIPNDTHFAQQWALHNIGQGHMTGEIGVPASGTADADMDAPEAWDQTVGSSGVVVAVFDTGIDPTHPDLAGALWTNPGEIPGNGLDDDGNGYVDDVNGYDFGRDTGILTDPIGHGTHVSGIIAATGGNGIGISGVSWRTKIMTLGLGDPLTLDAILEAYDYAARMGVRISNHSYGGYGFSQAEYDMIKYMRGRNHLIVTAAGNDANDNDAVVSYPDGYSLDNIVSVAASDHNDALADFSNFGATKVDLAAPGVDILSTQSSLDATVTLAEGYVIKSGTSMASPQVAGVAALLLSRNSAMSGATLKQTILSSVDKIASHEGRTVTGGRLNAAAAVAGRGAILAVFTFDDGGKTAEDLTTWRDWLTKWAHAGIFHGAVVTEANAYESMADSDGDGLPDAWEAGYGLDRFSAVGADGAGGDPDGDGLPNIAELKAGSDPTAFDTWGSGKSDYDTLIPGSGSTYGEAFDDGDGIPYDYELKYPGAMNPDEFDAHLDPDGDGWDNLSEFLAGTDPSDPASHPVPTVNARVDYFGAKPDVVRWIAWDNVEMDGVPIATGTVSDPVIGDVTLIVDTEEGEDGEPPVPTGALNNSNYFLFFADLDDSGTWDEGEPAGFPEGQPVPISGNGENVFRVKLTVQPKGYRRLFWEAVDGLDSYRLIIRRRTPSGAQQIFDRLVEDRTYLHEHDLQVYSSAFQYEMPWGNVVKPEYQWYVLNPDTNAELASGVYVLDWSVALSAPTALLPSGTWGYSRTELSWTHSSGVASRFTIEILSGGTSVYTTTIAAPPRNTDGRISFNLPLLVGDAPLDSGAYTWRVRAGNPYQSSPWSAAQSFVVDTTSQTDGPYSISGDLWYMGRATPANILIQAYSSTGFAGLPVAQTRIDGPGQWMISGLAAGTYYVQAFMDINANGACDTWEPDGILKAPDPYTSFYTIKPVPLGPSSPGHLLIVRDLDTDNDQYSDAWEWQKNGNLSTVQAGALVSNYPLHTSETGEAYGQDVMNVGIDQDGDGASDAMEIILGFDHVNPADTPPAGLALLTITATAPDQSWIAFDVTGGLPALQVRIGTQVQYSTDLVTWMDLPGTNIEVGPGYGPWIVTPGVSTTISPIFYRLRWYPLLP
ncbi:MAG: S8 family serine peptidase [Kiritimatiellae bacterium]|nr:S8 family serine peptidase [Kiritimatiellia bacterium]